MSTLRHSMCVGWMAVLFVGGLHADLFGQAARLQLVEEVERLRTALANEQAKTQSLSSRLDIATKTVATQLKQIEQLKQQLATAGIKPVGGLIEGGTATANAVDNLDDGRPFAAFPERQYSSLGAVVGKQTMLFPKEAGVQTIRFRPHYDVRQVRPLVFVQNISNNGVDVSFITSANQRIPIGSLSMDPTNVLWTWHAFQPNVLGDRAVSIMDQVIKTSVFELHGGSSGTVPLQFRPEPLLIKLPASGEASSTPLTVSHGVRLVAPTSLEDWTVETSEDGQSVEFKTDGATLAAKIDPTNRALVTLWEDQFDKSIEEVEASIKQLTQQYNTQKAAMAASVAAASRQRFQSGGNVVRRQENPQAKALRELQSKLTEQRRGLAKLRLRRSDLRSDKIRGLIRLEVVSAYNQAVLNVIRFSG